MELSGIVGHSSWRKEGEGKVRGTAHYIDDFGHDHQLFGTTIRSPLPRGTLKAITFDPTFDWSGFTRVTAADIPGKNFITLLDTDQPCLVPIRGAINHVGEPIALLAHADKQKLEAAKAFVKLDIEPLPPIFTIEEAETGPIIWGENNCFKEIHMSRGNLPDEDQANFRTVRKIYRTSAQEHMYIEPNGMIAEYSEHTGLTIKGSMQCPYYVLKALKTIFNDNGKQLRIVQTETGGAFGGKEDFPSVIAAHAGLLALKAKKAVRMIYERYEDMIATTKRHPSRITIESHWKIDGTLAAIAIDIALDGGAYKTLSPVVLSRCALHALGIYRCDNVRISARAYATNYPPHGAFRGFGAPQAIFAIERHMEEVAALLGLEPEDLRLRNALRTGDTMATGQIHRESDLKPLIERALKESNYQSKRVACAAWNKDQNKTRRGIGLATFLHGAGFTGSGEKVLASRAGLRVTEAGHVEILVASTEMGQGTNTVLAQIVAETLSIPYEFVSIAQPDTWVVPDSGPTVASRTVMVVGKILQQAAISLREQLCNRHLLPWVYTPKDFIAATQRFQKEFGPLVSYSQYQHGPHIQWDENTFQGDAYGTYAWAVYIAEVEVNLVDFSTTVKHFYALQDVGRVINPVTAGGQIEGGVVQGIGWALLEDCVYQFGELRNAQMTNYIIPTSLDVPPIDVTFLEHPYHSGPFGAKGIGELPMDGPAPAILNALQQALDFSVNTLPASPERLLSQWREHYGPK